VQAKKRSGTRSAAKSTSKPPEPVTFFVDESLDSLSVVDALREAGATVQRLTDRFPKGTPDETWLAEAGRNGWIVLTRDQRIRYRQLERLALQAAKVRAFVFTGGNVTGKETGAILAGSLERITKIASANPGPFIYHIGRSGRPIRMD
jgi:predicted nuclease of predicted toxin-antitoxin system